MSASTTTSRLLPSLQVFLLLGVFFLHLLRLLLMLLFHLLFLCLAGVSLLRLLVLSLLLLLQFLVFLLLLFVKFVLLLLVFLIYLCVSRGWGLTPLVRRKILCVNDSAGVGRTRNVVFRSVRRSCLLCFLDPMSAEASGFRSRSYRRFAMIL